MSIMNGELVLITGAVGSIGTAIVETLAREGASLLLLDTKEDEIKSLSARLEKEYGIKAKGYCFDICDYNNHHAFINELERENGSITVLINAAGITNMTTYAEMTVDEYDRMMEINLKAPFFFTREIFFRMKERKAGRIINFSSVAGERGAKYSGPHYSISKAGIISFTKILAKLAEDSGVTINTVSPGLIESEMGRQINAKVYDYDVPMNRKGNPAEVANAVLFLASNHSSYITGQNISVNGGQTMR